MRTADAGDAAGDAGRRARAPSSSPQPRRGAAASSTGWPSSTRSAVTRPCIGAAISPERSLAPTNPPASGSTRGRRASAVRRRRRTPLRQRSASSSGAAFAVAERAAVGEGEGSPSPRRSMATRRSTWPSTRTSNPVRRDPVSSKLSADVPGIVGEASPRASAAPGAAASRAWAPARTARRSASRGSAPRARRVARR